MPAETLFLGRTDAELAMIDPVWMNLVVARGVPALEGLSIGPYMQLMDEWVAEIKRQLPKHEERFRRDPAAWDNDIDMFRLGVVCYFVHNDLGIRYKEEQKYVKSISYTDPNDQFLSGVMDTRKGTCANMAVLHLAIGWRMRWPVSLAMAGWHEFLRFDNGKVVWNIETSNTEGGGFRTNPDRFYQEQYNIPQEAIDSGSDLTFLTPGQTLGTYFGARGRHFHDMLDPRVPKTNSEYVYYLERAKQDFDAALSQYPHSRAYRRTRARCDRYPSVKPARMTIGHDSLITNP